MNVQQKQEVVDALAARLKDASAFYLTDFTGLNVKRLTALRARLRKEGLQYVVVKNTLAERVLADMDLTEIAEFFKGPTGLVIGPDDPVTAARVLSEFAKENDNRPAIKAGIVDRRTVSAADVDRLAKLPPRSQLLAELAGAMSAPIAELAYVMQAKLIEFVGLLDALRTERDASTGASEQAETSNDPESEATNG
jgi:large subunit ribosomal protein L10